MAADSAPGVQRGHSTPRMLRLPMVAALLGLSESTLRRGVVAGDIPSKRLGKIVLIPADWVDEFTSWPQEESAS